MAKLVCVSLIAAFAISGAAFAQDDASAGTKEIPSLSECLADVETGDSAALDACVQANFTEIEGFISEHPRSDADPVDVPPPASQNQKKDAAETEQ